MVYQVKPITILTLLLCLVSMTILHWEETDPLLIILPLLLTLMPITLGPIEIIMNLDPGHQLLMVETEHHHPPDLLLITIVGPGLLLLREDLTLSPLREMFMPITLGHVAPAQGYGLDLGQEIELIEYLEAVLCLIGHDLLAKTVLLPTVGIIGIIGAQV